ncbi:MAG: isoleucine--tRNA ligase [Deltaproteobacteria bacterium]|nr:isoleucine--tRNA ligase [Deltaproteobacteria bacterium]
MSNLRPLSQDLSFPQQEEAMLSLWKNIDAFKRSVDDKEDSPENTYIFYDGPPFATGLPHYGHLVASTLKDIVPRYWTMRGKRVERRFGWDTHGLPIENLIEKELGLRGPTSIVEYGVAKFNEACRDGVMRYTAEWEKTISRLGRWVDFENDYKTMDLPFMESVWWVFSELFKKDMVYQGSRVMPYSWALSTPLSNFEAGSDYRDVDDPAVTVTMPLDGEDAHLLVWTTTPWTLPSNLGVAVGEKIDYVKAKRDPSPSKKKKFLQNVDENQAFVIAKDLLKDTLGENAVVLEEFKGSALIGKKYTPLFDYFKDHEGAFVVMGSGHVTTESGTGLVHMAPAYGEDDFAACQKVGIEPVDAVDPEGNFTDAVPEFVGQNIKAADKGILQLLKDKGRLVRNETLKHSYPFCWRTGTPLIYKMVPVWFIKVEAMQDAMVKNNEGVHWVPGAVGSGRFGNWLKDARDWAISRSRFWGTPIPLYHCGKCDSHFCVGSVEELEKRVASEHAGEKISDIHPHKIDHLELACEKCGEGCKRIPEVFDCWFESGAMPYAQQHYPFENVEKFEGGFPAEFIAEGLDQTRGWFYTLLVLSTALFDKAPFKNVVVNGMVLSKDVATGDWRKMSKKDKNYEPAEVALEKYGADALRAYLINSPVVRGEALKFDPAGIENVVRGVLLPLKNAWSFFTQYAVIDGWQPTDTRPDIKERSELDQWLLSVQQSLIHEVNEQMEGYYLYNVVGPILGFIDHLTNWYIRRSRRRFWRSADSDEAKADKASAYSTLYEVLVSFSKILAPVMPFISEAMYQHLVVEQDQHDAKEDSVHLTSYPQAREDLIHTELEAAMAATRAVVGLGRTLREKHKLKTRQPLQAATAVCHDEDIRNALEAHATLICEELNVKELKVLKDDASLSSMHFKANFKTLGRRMGKNMKEAAAAIGAFTRDQWNVLEDGGSIQVCDQDIVKEDVLVNREAIGEVVLESEGAITVALDTHVSEALAQEGLMRELVSKLQTARKEAGLDVTDRISLTLNTDDEPLRAAVESFGDYIKAEVLAVSLSFDALSSDVKGDELDVDGHLLRLQISKAS